MSKKTATTLIEHNEEFVFQRDLRRNIANMNETYTCTDITRKTTTPKLTTTWSYNEGPNNEPIIRNVGIVHEHRASQIHAIENFISVEECDAIQAMVESLLHRDTVADGKGVVPCHPIVKHGKRVSPSTIITIRMNPLTLPYNLKRWMDRRN